MLNQSCEQVQATLSKVRKANGRAWAPVAPFLSGMEELDGWRQCSFQSTMEGNLRSLSSPFEAAVYSDSGFLLDSACLGTGW